MISKEINIDEIISKRFECVKPPNREKRREIDKIMEKKGKKKSAAEREMFEVLRATQQPFVKKQESANSSNNAFEKIMTASAFVPLEDEMGMDNMEKKNTNDGSQIQAEQQGSTLLTNSNQNLEIENKTETFAVQEELEPSIEPKDDGVESNNEELKRLLAPFRGIDCQNPIWDDEHLPSNVCWNIAEIRKGKLSERDWIIKYSESLKKIFETYQTEFVWANVEIPEISKLDGQKIGSAIIEKLKTLLKNISDQKSSLETLSLNQPTTAAEWAQLSKNIAEAGNQDDVNELRKVVEALPLKEPVAPELQNAQNAEQERIRKLEETLKKAKEEHNKEIEQKEARIKELEKENEDLEKTYNEVEELHVQEIAKKEECIQELERKCKELEDERNRLKYKSSPPMLRTSNGDSDEIRRIEIPCTEKNLFPNEIENFLYQLLYSNIKKEIQELPGNERSRKKDILLSLESGKKFNWDNSTTGQNLKEIKRILYSSGSNPDKLEPLIKNCGFERISLNSHQKYNFYSDNRYQVTISTTPSDSKHGEKNLFTEIRNRCFLCAKN